MAAHRYWRLRLSQNNSRIQLAEIEFRGSIGGATLTTGGAPLVSGTSGGTSANLFDGSNATLWTSQIDAGPHWAGYDFVSAVDVVEVRARSGSNASYVSGGPNWLEYSDDAVAWVTLGPQWVMPSINSEYVVSGFSEIVGILQTPLAPLIAFAPSWPATPRVEAGAVLLTRPDYGGYGRIAGDVKIKGTPDAPVRRIVRLVREIDAICVAQQWSDPITGAYEFLGFDPAQRYTVLAYDELGGYRAAIASNVVPEPMTV